jgi:hypothetical protein
MNHRMLMACLLALQGLLLSGCARSERTAASPASAGTGSTELVNDAGEIRIEYAPLSAPTRMGLGSEAQIQIQAKNVGTKTWPSGGEHPLRFGYHWESPAGEGRWEVIVWDDSNRADLPSDTRPGETVVIMLPVRAPARACLGCRLVVAPLLELKAWSETARYPTPVDVS